MSTNILHEYENYDFGFTTEGSLKKKLDDLHVQHVEEVSRLKNDIKQLEALIMPLLVNLMKNPEQPTIKWPNRKEIIEEQIAKILAITRRN